MQPVKCELATRTKEVLRELRRYSNSSGLRIDVCESRSYHDAKYTLGTFPESDPQYDGETFKNKDKEFPHTDPRWPTRCNCGYEFQEKDSWQVFEEHLYEANGEKHTLRNAPIGWMWYATWFEGYDAWIGPDGKALMVKCPGNHDWHVDGPCSNCTRKNEPHKCWVRHGVPPDITVDKDGDTCAAGAGSILTPTWHGFLRNGYLIDC